MGTGTASCVLTPDRRVTVTLRLSAIIDVASRIAEFQHTTTALLSRPCDHSTYEAEWLVIVHQVPV